MRAVRWRLLPFLIVCYFAAYLDRVNIGFAALTMNADLGIGPQAFGFIAGIFFLGYCLFEVPSNIMLERFGARLWIARIMVSWGLISALTAFVTDVYTLAVARFLLGVAEAGFFPGIIYYLTHWVPARDRAAVVSIFMAAVPISNLIGAPLSGWILDAFHGVADYKGWQWLFILEALPSILLGIGAWFILIEKPEHARWLSEDERRALTETLEREDAERAATGSLHLRDVMTDRSVLLLGLVYFGIVGGMYGLSFWVPQIVKAWGISNTLTGLVAAIPYLFAIIAMVIWGRHSDRTGERRWHIALPCLVGGLALVAGAMSATPTVAFGWLIIAAMAIFMALPTFWTLPTAMLSGTAAAAGIALINSIGNVGGFTGPYVIGWMKGLGFSSAGAVASLAAALIVSGLVVAILVRPRVREPQAA